MHKLGPASAEAICKSGWESFPGPQSPSTDQGPDRMTQQRGTEPANTKGARSWKLEGVGAGRGNIGRDLSNRKGF